MNFLQKMPGKILLTFLFLVAIFLASKTQHISYAASTCSNYMQPNSCKSPPDGPITPTPGASFIITKCTSSGSTSYDCFDPNKGTYYTQPNTCTTGPLGSKGFGIAGHTYLVRKLVSGGKTIFSCVADCTTNPNIPHCPTASSTNPTVSPTGSASSGESTASLTLVLGLPGIGINAAAGVTPSHSTRTLTIELYDGTTTNPSGPGTHALSSTTMTVTYDNSSDNNAGYFVGTKSISLPATPPANHQYQILIEMPQYLFKLAVNPNPADASQPNVFTINNGANIVNPPLLLTPGAVVISNGNQNLLNAEGYTQIVTCFHNSSDPSCTKTSDGLLYADLDDNGTVDIIDLNIWLRSLYQLQQAQAPGCSSGACQGD